MSEPASAVGPLRFGISLRVVATVAALGLWFWTQSLIGSRAPSAGINDALHNLFSGLNSYFGQHASAANALLIVSSGFIDIFGLFLVAEWIFLGRSRPFLGLVLLLGLRQVMQALCALPAPANMIWRYPGFPSLLVTYKVGNDYFFSGHTAIAVFGAIELIRLRRRWLTVLALLIVVFEMATVLILRAHYTMDVFTGAVTALWVAALCDSVAPRIDRLVLTK
ncbi:MAG TPA: phosphatase PAP2-related protein [Candidatus Acidoferrum sp.]